jgi:Acyl-CoA dehydrogenase, C-terminal domain
MSIRPFDLPSADLDVVTAGREIVTGTFPVSRLREAGRASADGWRAMAEAGWTEAWTQSAVDGSGLSSLCHVATAAGSVALVDEFVNNVVILPALASRSSDRERHLLAEPGFLVEDLNGNPVRAFGYASGLRAVGVGTAADGAAECRVFRDEEFTISETRGTSGAVAHVTLAPAPAGAVVRAQLSEAERGQLRGAAMVVHAAALIGLGYEAVRRTCEYLLIREQFGRRIAEYQALQHLVANAYVNLETAWTLCEHAAESRDDRAVSIARYLAVHASNDACMTMQQLFGGIGFTAEHDCHFFTKAALAGRYRFAHPEMIARTLAEDLARSADTEISYR